MSDSQLLNLITEDMKDAMRKKESARLGTIRLLQAAIKQYQIDFNNRNPLDDGQIVAVIDKMIKQRLDSIEQYKKGNREDLATKEAAEIEILKAYMPQPLSDNETDAIIQTAIIESQATSVKDMAKVMNLIKSQAQGRADIGKISAKVRQLLMINC